MLASTPTPLQSITLSRLTPISPGPVVKTHALPNPLADTGVFMGAYLSF
jgi:hypothetical protein